MSARPSLLVQPIRFSDNIDALTELLVACGLAPVVRSRSGGWVELAAGAGRVAIHTASTSDAGHAQGSTSFTGRLADAESSMQALRDAGFQPSLVDESYGHDVHVVDPSGCENQFATARDDMYGYDELDGEPDARVTVVPVVFCDPQGAWSAFVQALGLRRLGDPGEPYVQYTTDGHGDVGLHHDHGHHGPSAGAEGCALTLQTSEDLDACAARLVDAGFDARVLRDDAAPHVAVTDADGLELEIHEAPR